MSGETEARENAWVLGQAARAIFNKRCGEINQNYIAARDKRSRDHDLAFNHLRDRAAALRRVPPAERDEQALADLQVLMEDHRKAPKPTFDDLEQARQGAIAAEDMKLRTVHDEIRERYRKGELSNPGNMYI